MILWSLAKKLQYHGNGLHLARLEDNKKTDYLAQASNDKKNKTEELKSSSSAQGTTFEKVELDSGVLDGFKAVAEELGIKASPTSPAPSVVHNDPTRYRGYSKTLSKSYNLAELMENGEVETYSSDLILKLIDHVSVTGLECDREKVDIGDLFFCLTHEDCVKDITGAFEKGAVAVVCDVKISEKLAASFQESPIIEVDDPT